MFFSDVTLAIIPVNKELSLFSCDERYFINFGIYNTLSASLIGLPTHVHVLNPTVRTFDHIEKLKKKCGKNLSFSFENFDSSGLHKLALKTYYFSSRYFISQYLFKNTDVETLYITDTDVIFNKKPSFETKYSLGLIYNPQSGSAWKKTDANFVFVRKNKETFLSDFIEEYQKRYQLTDWQEVEKITDKLQKNLYVGLDQVCLGSLLDSGYSDSEDFLRLSGQEIRRKQENCESIIWTLTGGGKKQDINLLSYLSNKYPLI